jgi:hypothetical protein
MNINHGNNLSGIEWQCSHCGAFNKVAAAKFCGKCGSAREKEILKPVLKAEDKSTFKDFKSPAKTKILAHLKRIFYPTKKKMYKAVIASAFILLAVSLLSGYKMYTNVNAIHLTKTKFSDVSLDHPIYTVCKNLLEIDAISFRKNVELAPYEQISASEWNHVINQASKYLNMEIPDEAYFSKNEAVTLDNINHKLRQLKPNSSEIPDTSRIQSFYMLEQTLFN